MSLRGSCSSPLLTVEQRAKASSISFLRGFSYHPACRTSQGQHGQALSGKSQKATEAQMVSCPTWAHLMQKLSRMCATTVHYGG